MPRIITRKHEASRVWAPTTDGYQFNSAEAQTPPQLQLKDAKQNQTYLVVGLDIDAPFPRVDFLGPILHWVQHSLKADETGVLTAVDPFIVDYIGPAPPPLSSPHRYCFYVYEQPTDFDAHKFAPAGLGNAVANTKRMRYNLDAFERDAKLAKVVGVNYFKSN